MSDIHWFAFCFLPMAFGLSAKAEECSSVFPTAFISFVGGFLLAAWIFQTKPKKETVEDVAVSKVENSNISKYAKREKELYPMAADEFRRRMMQIVEFIADYSHDPTKYKVMAKIRPGDIIRRLPSEMPNNSESFDSVFKDFNEVILPGLLHWQHPRFHGYFSVGMSYPDILGDALISGVSVVPFSWTASPSFSELEVVVVNWLGKALGLPKELLFSEDPGISVGGGAVFYGASETIFCSLMVSRKRKLSSLIKENSPNRREKESEILAKLVVYASAEAHSSIEKACNMAMVQMRAIPVDKEHLGMRADKLESAIRHDLAAGLLPFHIHGTMGTTATAAMDDLEKVGRVAAKYDLWFHVDGAYGASALICPEFRHLMNGIEYVHSFNLNMHKMMLMSVPVSILWCRSQFDIKTTFAVDPAYLKQKDVSVVDFRNWGIKLARRAQCLKIWFLLRMYGLDVLREYIRRMCRLCQYFTGKIREDSRFEIIGRPMLTLVAFRLKRPTEEEANDLTQKLCEHINRSCDLFVTHAKPNGKDVIRVNMSHQLSMEDDVDESYRLLSNLTDDFISSTSAKQFSSLRYQGDLQSRIEGSPISSSNYRSAKSEVATALGTSKREKSNQSDRKQA